MRARTQQGAIGRTALSGILLAALLGCGDSKLDQLLGAARSSDVDQQRLALRQLAELEPRASEAIPDLIMLTEHSDADVRRLATLALGNIAAEINPDTESLFSREEIVGALGMQLDDANVGVRHSAAFALLGLDADHEDARKCLQVAMSRGDGGIIDRLKSMQPAPTWAIPTLIELLRRDQRPGIRRLSAVTLGAIAADDSDARSALQQARQDTDDRVRDAARQALQNEQPEA